MDTKVWYQSKIVWTGAILALISILQQVQEWYAKGDFSVPGWIGLAIGILIIILRVFFTTQPIDTPKSRKAMREKAETDSRLELIKADQYHGTLDQRPQG